MGNTNISSIGNMFAQVQSTGRTENAGEDIRIAFAETMSQMMGMAGGCLTPGKQMQDAGEVQTKGTGVESAYDRYQYRDNSIREGTQTAPAEEQVAEKFEEYENDVKEILQEELGVSEEDIEKALETLGLTYADLINPKQLVSLAAELTGVQDMSEMLCNSEFVTVMQEVGVLSEQLLKELGISAEEFVQVLQEAQSAVVMKPNADAVQNADGPQDITAEEAVAVEGTEIVQEIADDAPLVQKTDTPEDSQTEAAVETKEAQPEKDGQHVQKLAEQPTEEEQTFAPREQSGQSDQSDQSDTGNQNSQTGHENIVVNHPQTDAPQPQLQPAEKANAFSQQLDVENIIKQIAEFSKTTVSNRAVTMEMQLNPHNLGKIYLEVTSKDGAVFAHITAQNEVVKEALESQLVELRQNMNQAGVKVDAVEVTVGSHEFERNLEQNAKQGEHQGEAQEQSAKRTRHLRMDDLEELSGVMTEEEALVAQMMAEQGNSVDFTA